MQNVYEEHVDVFT